MKNPFRFRALPALLFGILMLALLCALFRPVPAFAGNTWLWGQQTGDVLFPFTPPSPNAPGAIDNMNIGQTTPALGNFTSLKAAQITPNGGTPTIASGACGTTTNGALVAGSTNQSGSITIGSATTTSCTVSFSAPLPAAPLACVLEPENATAAQADVTGAYISAITTAHFVITGLALTSSNYGFHCL